MALDGGSISSRLGLNIGPYAQGMLQAQSIAQLFPSVVSSFLANPLLGLAEIAKSVAGSVRAAFAEMNNFADDMGDLAEQVGVAVETLTALGQVASLSGGDVQGVGDAFRFLGKNVAEAMQDLDSAAAKTFRELGIALVDANGNARPLEEIMLELADAIARLPAGAMRTAIAMDLLGRGGTQMIPILSQGSAALREQMARMQQYGAVVTQENRAAADAWNDATGEIGIAWQGLKMSFSSGIRDSLLPYLQRVLSWVRDSQPRVAEIVAQLLGYVAAFPGKFVDAFLKVRSLGEDVLNWSFMRLSPAIESSRRIIGSFYSLVLQPLGNWLSAVGRDALAAFAYGWDVVRETFGDPVTAAKRWLDETLESVNRLLEELEPNLKAAWIAVADEMRKAGIVARVLWEQFDREIAPKGITAVALGLAGMKVSLDQAVVSVAFWLAGMNNAAEALVARVVPALAVRAVGAFNLFKGAVTAADAVISPYVSSVQTIVDVVATSLVPAISIKLAGAWKSVTDGLTAFTTGLQTTLDLLRTIYSVAEMIYRVAAGGPQLPSAAAAITSGTASVVDSAQPSKGSASVGTLSAAGGPPAISVNAPALDEDRLARALAAELEPKIDQRMKAAEAAAKAARQISGAAATG